ncbi:hypothetical protein [Shivajiella indica]|uniref:Uncharacterized protein n=1 Tax=Shivajiella indica TaxID=872115 RepID=A0ABW5B8U1_9BACT
MKRLCVIFLFLLNFSCDEKEVPKDIEPIAIEDRMTLAELSEVRAFLDVEQIGEDFETGFVFMLELTDDPEPKFLHVSNDELICGFLNDQMVYGTTFSSNCARADYFERYLYGGSKGGNYRMHVTISGKIKEKFDYDLFSGKPFVLENIFKIPSCPIVFEEKEMSPNLENNFWQLHGFIDENGEILSYPTCEDPRIGIYFYDTLLLGTPIEFPEAKTFEVQTAANTRPYQLFSVYSIEGEGRIRISLAVNSGWMPPRPPTIPTDNFYRLTMEIKNKYDSLNLILRAPNEIEYAIDGNVLELYNPGTGVRGRFFIP